jgi:hypothetical protein
MSTEIDLKARKSETEWQQILDVFWKKATPQWFDWLEWILILAVIDYVAQRTHSVVLKFVSGLSYSALFFYLQSFFFSLKFKGLPLVKSDNARRLVSLSISALLTMVVWLFFRSLLAQLRGRV